MDELIFAGYVFYKQEVDRALRDAVEDFVKIGYLLKSAREHPELLDGSGYSDYKEFAKKEYNLDESQVSRFIAINERYGAGPTLKSEYVKYSQSHLIEMLSLPETVAAEIPSEITREELREIKRDIKEDQKISDIEVLIEEDAKGDTTLEKVMRTYFEGNFAKYERYDTRVNGADGIDEKIKQAKEMLMPMGETAFTVRVSGMGAMLVTLKEYGITLTNTRSGEKENAKWEELVAVCGRLDIKPPAEPETKPETKPDTKPDTKSETKPKAKPDAKPDTKPAPTACQPGKAADVWEENEEIAPAQNKKVKENDNDENVSLQEEETPAQQSEGQEAEKMEEVGEAVDGEEKEKEPEQAPEEEAETQSGKEKREQVVKAIARMRSLLDDLEKHFDWELLYTAQREAEGLAELICELQASLEEKDKEEQETEA